MRKLLIASISCGHLPDDPYVPMNHVSLEWLFRKSAILLWADTLYMTERDFRNVHKLDYFPSDIEKDAARHFFDRLAAEGVITTFNQVKYLPEVTRCSIQEQVESDEAMFGVDCGGTEDGQKSDLCTIAVGEHRYCQPIIRGIYGSLTISRFLECSCLLNHDLLQFCEDRFAQLLNPGREVESGTQVFTEVYNVLLPSLDIINDFRLFCPPSLRQCMHIDDCLTNTPVNLQQLENMILTTRSRPEVVTLAKYVDRLLSEVGPDEKKVWAAIRRDVAKQQKAVFAGFADSKAWTSILEKTAGLVALFGASKGDALLALSAGGIAGAAALAGVAVDHLSARTTWLATLVANANPKQIGPSGHDS